MPELPVDEEKEQLEKEAQSLATEYAFAKVLEKDFVKAETAALELLEIKLNPKFDPKIGMSRITDLKEELNFLLTLREQFKEAKQDLSKKTRKRIRDIQMLLFEVYDIPFEDEEKKVKIEYFVKQLEALKKKKENIEAKGKEAPLTTKRIKEVEVQLNQLNKEPGNTMAKDVDQAVKVQNVEVVRHGDKLTIPQNLDIMDAIKLLQARARYEEEIAHIIEQYDVFPWDGAIALGNILKRIFGWIPQEGASVMVDSGVNERVSVPWGEFKVPGIDGKMQCGISFKEGRVIFKVDAFVKHKHEHIVKDILKQVKEELKTSSIYRGKAFKIRFLDDKGRKLEIPEPKFIDVMSINENDVAYAKPVADAIETNLFTPIRRVKELEANGLKLQRSVMLGGMFGTGKTLAAGVAAKLAVQQGMTYIYVPRADELSHALAFSRQYQDPACMIFCEDIDRVLAGERSVEIDDILNIIDGVDTKNDRRMLVFTTNDLDAIQPAMLRPGRLDAVIEVTPPDAQAAWRLIQIYGKGTLSPNVDGTVVGNKLAGQIPAVIAEVVKRAKLSEMKFTPIGSKIQGISTEALLDASETMTRQLALLNRGDVVPTKLEEAIAVLGAHMHGYTDENIAEHEGVMEITEKRAEAARKAPAIHKAA